MALLERVKDLISSNVNDMLTKAEDPEKMANEYLRQLNEQYYEAKTQVAQAMADESRLYQQMITAQSDKERWQRRAEIALRDGNEDMAKQALQHKLQARQLAEQYEKQYAAQDEQVDDLEEALALLESRITETQARRDLIVAKKNRMQTMQAIRGASAAMGGKSAMDKLDQMEQRVDHQVAQAEAMAQLESNSLESEFQQLDEDSAVDAELEELKRSLGL
jgi:phage shock protein A